MIRLRRGTVLEARVAHAGATAVVVDLDGARASALAYDALTPHIEPGDVVVLNTAAVELGLGTGGLHLVVAVEGRETRTPARGHAMKMRYSPLQVPVDAVEETHRDALDAVDSLGGLPVVVAPLHSALAPALIGARALAPDARLAYVMTDLAALPLAFSRSVPALRAAGLLDVTITAGQAFGGDHEAVSVAGALAAALAVARADLVVVAMGPGNLGTGSRWGSAALEVATAINVVGAMGGRAVVAPRISFADARARHAGVSHHTRTALETFALVPADVALPPLARERATLVRDQLAGAGARHRLVDVELGKVEDALAGASVPLATMGRGYAEDPDYFRTAAAAGVFAARLTSS